MESIIDILKDVSLWNSLGLSRPYLRRANLSDTNLSDTNLTGADLPHANLSGANLTGASLPHANLFRAKLSCANLFRANLSCANLICADLSCANLFRANLSGANLSGANLFRANLSGTIGLPSAEEFLEQFPHDADGIIVFRAEKGGFSHPSSWKFTPGSILEEIPNPDRATVCGCGVSFATEKWVRTQYPHATVWKCRIRWAWLADVVVPFHTDGKARCRKLEILEALSR